MTEIIGTNEIFLEECWQYDSQAACLEATGQLGLVVSYGKHGLTLRKKESRNSFVIFPIEDYEN